MGLDRREFLTVMGAAGIALRHPIATTRRGSRRGGIAQAEAWLFLTDPEIAFVTAAIEVMIPADDMGPGGTEAGVVHAIDRQLSGAFGAGSGLYRSGPWEEDGPHHGWPRHGWQNPLSPADFIRMAIAEADGVTRAGYGIGFAALPLAQRDEVLMGLAQGDITLTTLSGRDFVGLLWATALEGYFGDPAYGGNRGMASWRMIGFPGARLGGFGPLSLADLQ
jgi:gluconate 2-dehydrogenase gamma chain